MTRKAHNVDRKRTATMQFLDKRSYWTLRGHMYLFGKDVGIKRQAVYEVSGGYCDCCGGWCGIYGELHHIKGGNTDDRCWCPHNLQWICKTCHRKKHVAPQFGVRP